MDLVAILPRREAGRGAAAVEHLRVKLEDGGEVRLNGDAHLLEPVGDDEQAEVGVRQRVQRA